MKNLKYTISALALIIGISATAQKNKTLSAIMTYKEWVETDEKLSEDAKSTLMEAKGYIDESYAYESDKFVGKKDAKTLYYKGKIYMSFQQYVMDPGMQKQVNMMELLGQGLEAYQMHIELPDKKSKDDKTAEIKMELAMLRDQAVTLATNMFNAGKYEMALNGYAGGAELLKIAGVTDTASYFNGGLCAAILEKWDTAANYFEICATNDFGGALSYSKWGEALFKQGKEDEAIKALEQGRAKYPKDPDLYITEGNHWMLNGENEKATAALKKAIDADPENETVYFAVAALQSEQGNYEEAKKMYTKALELNPEYFDALYGLGALHYNKGVEIHDKIQDIADNKLYEEKKVERDTEFKAALPFLEKAKEINPKDKPTLNALYKVYLMLRMNDEAMEVKDLLSN